MSSTTAAPDQSPLLFALVVLRIVSGSLGVLIVFGSLGFFFLNRSFKRLSKHAYQNLETPPEPSSVPDPEEITPVVVKRLLLRQPLILGTLFLTSLLYLLGDGGIVVAQAVVNKVWEPSTDAFEGELPEILALGLSFGIAAVCLAGYQDPHKPRQLWKSKFPFILGITICTCQIVALGLFGALLHAVGKVSVWASLHLAVAALRTLTLSLLTLSYTNAFKKSDFIPAAQAQAPESYGTFNSNDNTTQQSQAEPVGVVEHAEQKQKKDEPGFKAFFQRIKILSPYLWPKSSTALQLVALICFGLLIAGRVVNLLVPLYLGRLVSALASGSSPWLYLSLFVGLKFLQGSGGILQAMQSILWVPVSQYNDRSMTLMSFRHLLSLSMSYHTRRKTGEVLRVLDRGAAINNFFQMVIFSVFPMLLDTVVAVIFVAIQFDIVLSLVLFVTMASYVAASVILTNMRIGLRRDMNNQDKYCRQLHTDALMNVESVKFFGAEEYENTRYSSALHKYQKAELKVLMTLSLLNLVQNLIISLGLLVGSLVVAYEIVNGQRDVASFVTFNAYLMQLYGPLNALGTYYRAITQNLTDTDNLMKLLEEPAEIVDRPDAQELQTVKGTVEFKDVCFSYDGKIDALKNVNFTIPAGTSAAFVGASGAGKSTIFRLMFRFYEPTSGAILLDGVDIRQYTQASLRKAIGVIPQDTALFNDTIEYNIRYGRPTASLEEVQHAARLAQLHDRISAFPQGYATEVGERGIRLSGGEKQRVSIARAILKDSRLVLQDEATSALDTGTERLIQQALSALQAGRTSIAIAHRLSTIARAQQLLVIDDGQVAERGTFDELIQSRGIFATLWEKQVKRQEEEEQMTANTEGTAAASGDNGKSKGEATVDQLPKKGGHP